MAPALSWEKSLPNYQNYFNEVQLLKCLSPLLQYALEVWCPVLSHTEKRLAHGVFLHSFDALLSQAALSLTVRRNGETHRLSLTPQTWSGRGLLGYG